MDKQPRPGDTRLPRRAENAVADPARGLFDIGILQHDGRRFAAQLQRGRDQFFRRHVRQMTARGGTAGKGNFAHARMTRQRIANHRAFARQHAQQPGGQPGLFKIRASSSAISGVASAGLRITAFPAAIAGATFCISLAIGEFHGVMAATTPSGS